MVEGSCVHNSGGNIVTVAGSEVEKPMAVSAPPDPPASRHGLCSHRPHRLPPFGRVKALGPLYVFVVV
jgi:hypothetical protein